MADRVSLAFRQLNRIKSQALENQRLTQRVEKSFLPAEPVFNGAGHPSWVSRAHPSFPLRKNYHFIDKLSQALENQRLTFTMFAMFLFIRQSFRYSGFQSSSSKLLIYTSQKERISFSSPAKKLS